MRERSRSGAAGPILLGAVGATGLAALTLAAGGGLLLAFIAYSLGGSFLLLSAAMAAAYRPVAALRTTRRPARLPVFEGLRHG